MTPQVTQPLIELVDEREFTDREEELAFFWDLAMKAKERLALASRQYAVQATGQEYGSGASRLVVS